MGTVVRGLLHAQRTIGVRQVKRQFQGKQFPTGSPIANALVAVLGVVVLSLSLALGLFVFLALAGVVMVAAAVLAIRSWWHGRRVGRRVGRRKSVSGDTRHQIIEGQFREVEPQDRDRPNR